MTADLIYFYYRLWYVSYMYKLAFYILFSKHGTYNFRLKEGQNCKEIQINIKLQGFSLSLSLSPSTWMIFSPVFRVKKFDIDTSICIIWFYEVYCTLNVLISSLLLLLWWYRFNVYLAVFVCLCRLSWTSLFINDKSKAAFGFITVLIDLKYTFQSFDKNMYERVKICHFTKRWKHEIGWQAHLLQW